MIKKFSIALILLVLSLFAVLIQAEETRHIKQITGLQPNTTYHYRITTKNAQGEAVTSNDYTFTTPAATTAPPPPTSGYHAPAPTSSLVVNVKDKGATGNGSTNDTAAIQAAVNQVGGTGGTVFVPNGTYMIDALTSVALKSNMTFKMDSGAVLKAIRNGSGGYNVVRADYVTNLNIVGGTIKGERHEHLTPGDLYGSYAGLPDYYGEWGMCLFINGGSTIYVEGVTARECWGDGFYIKGNALNTYFYSVTGDDNRRNNLSVVDANGMVIRDSVFNNANGTQPMAGIDLESNADSVGVSNITITNNTISNSKYDGMDIACHASKPGIMSNIVVTNNTITGSGQMSLMTSRIGNGRLTFSNNTLRQGGRADGRAWWGVRIQNAPNSNNTYTNNIISVSPRITSGDHGGAAILAGTGNKVTGNTITGYPLGVVDSVGGNTISPNAFNP